MCGQINPFELNVGEAVALLRKNKQVKCTFKTDDWLPILKILIYMFRRLLISLTAEINDVFIVTVDQIAMCNETGFTCSDKTRENYHLQLSSAPCSVLSCFSSLFGFRSCNCLFPSHFSHQFYLQSSRLLFLAKKL